MEVTKLTPNEHYPLGDGWFQRNVEGSDFDLALGPMEHLILSLLANPAFPDSRRVRLVEVGCSRGDSLAKISANSSAVCIGIDFSPLAIAAGQQMFEGFKSLTLMVGNATEIPLKTNSADVLIFGWVAMYLDDKGFSLALNEAKRVVAPGGLLCLLDFEHKGPVRTTPNKHHKGLTTYRRDYSEALVQNVGPLVLQANLTKDANQIGVSSAEDDQLIFLASQTPA